MKKKIILRSENQLIDYFKNNTLKLDKNSSLSFKSNLKLGSNIIFSGKVILGKNNIVESNCHLKDVNIGHKNHIKLSSIIRDSKVSNNITIGPFAYIRDNTSIDNNSVIGAYVEITRSVIYQKVYASHRTFIGDAKIGSNTIIGAGVVFCNYNFKKNKKEKTLVGKNCKIGANSTIIAPCKILSGTVVPALTKFKKINFEK